MLKYSKRKLAIQTSKFELNFKYANNELIIILAFIYYQHITIFILLNEESLKMRLCNIKKTHPLAASQPLASQENCRPFSICTKAQLYLTKILSERRREYSISVNETVEKDCRIT